MGEHLKYLVWAQGRPIACMAWSSAPRHLGSRDRHIGWSAEARRRNIRFVAYNTRFLILPWVRVPHPASHILGRIASSLSNDWEQLYGHPVYFAETASRTEGGSLRRSRRAFPTSAGMCWSRWERCTASTPTPKDRGLTAEERREFHKTHSAPVLEELRQWMETQFSEHKTEPNSGPGKAISYLLRHWTKLTLFLRQQGTPLDNNIVERALKKAILRNIMVRSHGRKH